MREQRKGLVELYEFHTADLREKVEKQALRIVELENQLATLQSEKGKVETVRHYVTGIAALVTVVIGVSKLIDMFGSSASPLFESVSHWQTWVGFALATLLIYGGAKLINKAIEDAKKQM